eukprot:Skav220020  [mRNA]  locus=scaffold3413:161570:169117:- [translate_table: standard]
MIKSCRLVLNHGRRTWMGSVAEANNAELHWTALSIVALVAFAVGLAVGALRIRRWPAPRAPRASRRLGDLLVEAEENVSAELLDRAIGCVPFQDWLRKLQTHRSSFHLRHVAVPRYIGCAGSDGDPLAGICFLRGGSVAVLVILQSEETGIDNVCTAQPQYMALPAGMLDGNGDFGGAMAREMEEETGIRCWEQSQVYGDGFEGMYPSVGACDEFIRLFLFRKQLPQQQIMDLEGKLMGLREENEKIKCLDGREIATSEAGDIDIYMVMPQRHTQTSCQQRHLVGDRVIDQGEQKW